MGEQTEDSVIQIRIKRGLDLPVMGAPKQQIENGNPVSSVAILGRDYLGVKPRLMVQEGDRVKLGQTLFVSKMQSSVHFTSPASGVIKNIERGPRRVLRSIEIKLEGDEEEDFSAFRTTDISSLTPEHIRKGLLVSGLWSSLRTRPYSRIPSPRKKPFALFVTAMDTNPLCANAGVVIAQASEYFRSGLEILARLIKGKVYVCTAAGENVPIPQATNIQHAEFSGPHPSGLVGTHIHNLAPASAHRTVWHLGYQDVIAIGEFFATGRLNPERIISIAGPAVKNPRLLRTRLGANTNELVEQELETMPSRVISGSILSGHHAAGWAAYLGRYHNQVSVLPDSQDREFMGWLSPGINKFSSIRVLLSSIFKRKAYWMTTLQNGSPRAMVPIGNYERVMPLDILPTQLLRALLVSDTEKAQGLGVLELDEEDLALCSYVCPSKYDYGPMLRRNLDLIRKES